MKGICVSCKTDFEKKTSARKYCDDCKNKSIKLYLKGYSLKEIAKKTNMKKSTIEGTIQSRIKSIGLKRRYKTTNQRLFQAKKKAKRWGFKSVTEMNNYFEISNMVKEIMEV